MRICSPYRQKRDLATNVARSVELRLDSVLVREADADFADEFVVRPAVVQRLGAVGEEVEVLNAAGQRPCAVTLGHRQRNAGEQTDRTVAERLVAAGAVEVVIIEA